MSSADVGGMKVEAKPFRKKSIFVALLQRVVEWRAEKTESDMKAMA